MRQLLYVLMILFFMSVKAQQIEFVDYIKAEATIGFNPSEKEVIGLVKYDFKILKDVDSVFIDAKNFKINSIFNNNGAVNYRYDKSKIILYQKYIKDKDYNVTIDYTVKPKKALYFVERDGETQIWTQGQGKYTSNWLPSIDDMNDKIEFDLSLFYDKKLQAIGNGKKIVKTDHGSDTVVKFDMQKPMSSYLVALAIGKYNKKELISKSGIPIELYYYPEDSAKVEPTYRYTKQMFDFLEEEIGVPYPWQNYKQVPVKDFLYSGMENTSLTIFSDDFMIDNTSFIDKNYVNVNAHELAHQWFGDLVTETEGKHHWLQEGFATYYALLAERDIFGDDYYYWRLYEYAQELKAQDEAGQSTALLDPKASSTTFYKKGAWALHRLREEVGDESFKEAVKNYLEKFKYKNVETKDFINVVETTAGLDLSKFVDNWLVSDNLLDYDIKLSLERNEMASFLITHEANPYLTYRKDNNDNYIPSSLVNELPEGFFPIAETILIEALNKPDYPTYSSLLKDAFESNSLKVRQAIAQNLAAIPKALKEDYETLLNDKSYLTIESALYHLWMNFPEERKNYLEQTKVIYGFNDYNVKTLWLLLALNTENYNNREKRAFYKELVQYTSAKNGFQLRQNAFAMMQSMNLFSDIAIQNLIDASKHHNWRFKSFAKKILETLKEDEKYKEIIVNLQTKQE